MILFDIRTDDSHAGLIAMVNCGLDREPGNLYLARFGHVGGQHCWNCFDRGDLPVEILSGEVTHSGLRIDVWTGEQENVVDFVCDGQIIGYDQVVLGGADLRR